MKGNVNKAREKARKKQAAKKGGKGPSGPLEVLRSFQRIMMECQIWEIESLKTMMR